MRHPIATGVLVVCGLVSAAGLPDSLLAADTVVSDASDPRWPPAVSFVNDVLPVLSKAGCNQGTCHGSATGKGGFKLSLRGFAPELDYAALVREDLGRRVDHQQPAASLLLRKPTAQVAHQGGRVLPIDGPGYELLLAWIAHGAPGPSPDEPRLVDLTVSPAAVRLAAGEPARLRVAARFAGGIERDVTDWARFDSGDASVVMVNERGCAQAISAGRTGIAVAYQDRVVGVEVTVPYADAAAERDYARLPRNNFVDDLVIAAWQQVALWPSDEADDATFLRRVHLDLTGTLPTAEGVRAFRTDADPHRRQAVVDRLLDSPAFVDMWTQKWSDHLRVSREWLGERSMWTFYQYLKDRIARNVPWDVVVRELIAGSGDSAVEGPPNYYRLQKIYNEAELWPLVAAETTAQTFLGIRMQCARCHNHPLDRWTQADYYGLASCFARVAHKKSSDGDVVIYEAAEGEIPHPRLGQPLSPKAPGGPQAAAGASRRQFLAQWITAPDNPLFARATANRVWRHLMGRGLIEPVDDLRPSNPATNEPLLEALARDLVAHGYDVRHLMRTILASRAYGRSSQPTPENRADRYFYSHYLPRRMTAEQLLDAVGQVTGRREQFAGAPTEFTAQQLPDTKFASTMLDTFGRPLRRVASCECERVQEPNLRQALEMMHNAALDERVTSDDALVARCVASGASDRALLDEIYVRALGRDPSETEAQAVLAQAVAAPPREDGESQRAARREFFEDVLWSVVNSKEFLFNH